LMDKAINYAATKFADSVRTTQPKVLSYTPNLMATIPGVPVMPSDVTPAIKEARELVAAEYEKRIADKERMEVLAVSYNLNSTHIQQLTVLTQALVKDIEALRGVGEVCFSDLSNCLSKKCEVFNKLTPYNEDVFRLGLDEGLIAYYPLDVDARDASGNHNDGKETGTATIVAGKVGSGAYKFSGRSYITVPKYEQLPKSSIDLQKNDFTLAVWARNYQGSNSTSGSVLYRYTYTALDSGGDTGFGLSTTLRGGCGLALSSRHVEAGVGNGSKPADDGQWHHFLCTYDGNFLKLYIDGQEHGATPYSAGSYSSNQPLYIGYNPWRDRCDKAFEGNCTKAGYGSGLFIGELDDIRIYNRALTAAEVLQLSQMK